MTETLANLSPRERLLFLVTNRLPRRWLTLMVGRISKIENRLLSWVLINSWRLFVDDLRLYEAEKSRFSSLHDCFTRRLKPGVRPIEKSQDVVISPCDAEVGQFGSVNGLKALQAKGFPYEISDLLLSKERAERFRNGRYVTLRLKSSMYHRLHAPLNGVVNTVHYVSGDTWNVSPISLRVIERLFCKNERAVLDLEVDQGCITLVPVAAILVASMRFHGLDHPLNLNYRGANTIPLHQSYTKGEEMGYFEHGSTVVIFTSEHYQFCPQLTQGNIIRMGQALMTLRPATPEHHRPEAQAEAA